MGQPKKVWNYKMVKEFIESVGCEFLSSEYINENSIIIIKCPQNHIYETTFKEFKVKGKRTKSLGCGTCKRMLKANAVINRVGYENVKEYVESLNYSILTKKEDFKGVSNEIELVCNKNHYQKVTFEAFKKRKLNGQNTINKCFECFNEKKLEIARDRANELGYTLHTTKYTGVDNELELTCDKGHRWVTTYDRFVRVKNLCLTCNNILLSVNQRLPFEEVRKRIEIDGYKLLSDESDYENNESLLTVKCPKNHIYKVPLNNFSQGKRCLRCIQSKGEKEVERVLDLLNISYIKQYRFKNCKYKNTLPFDFFIPSNNICIEYDGQQHFKEGHFGCSSQDFKEIQIKDGIKTKYCLDNNIKLIRIPYWEFNNIEKILRNNI